MKRAAFTLVELLVVVAVIGMLIAILAPALTMARGATRSVVCRTHLHQVGLATQMYLQNNDERLWRYYEADTDGRRWWFGFEPGGPGTGTHRPLDQTRSVLYEYLATTDDQLECPDFQYGADFYPKFDERAATYGYNIKLGPTSSMFDTASMPRLDSPASVFVFADAIHFDHNPGYNEGHYVQRANVNTATGFAHFRHRGGKANYLLLDLHVDGQQLTGGSHKDAGGGPAGNLVGESGGNEVYGPTPKRR